MIVHLRTGGWILRSPHFRVEVAASWSDILLW